MTAGLSRSAFAEFGKEWVEAFNSHDLNRILRHYHPAIILISPLYLARTGGMSDQVSGIDALAAYFASALRRYPDLHFQLFDIADGARGPCLRYRSSTDGRIGFEAFELDANGQATRVTCHYVAG